MRERVSVANNLYPYSLHSMIKVSAEAWHAILYLVTVTPWQYHRGLACYSISYHALAVSTEAWHPYHALAVSQRLGMLSYILSLSRLGSIRRGLACYSISYHALAVSAQACYPISYHALAVSAEAWHAILYPPWQYLPRLGMLFYIWEAQVEQTETCRRAGSERHLVSMPRRFQILQVAEDTLLASAANLQYNSCQKFRKNMPCLQIFRLISLLWFHMWQHMHWNTWFQEISSHKRIHRWTQGSDTS